MNIYDGRYTNANDNIDERTGTEERRQDFYLCSSVVSIFFTSLALVKKSAIKRQFPSLLKIYRLIAQI